MCVCVSINCTMDGYFIGYEGGAEVKRYCDSYYTVQFKTIHQGESG